MPVAAPVSPDYQTPTASRLAWLTPARCRLILAALLLFGFLSHLHYLRQPHCPIDLSPDEAHYWEWSRKPDIGYYSKGPLVAWIIRGSTSLFGHHMWSVRLPALVLAAATSLLTYWLTARLYKSERLALGAVLLTHLVPLFVAGSLLMTIDPPYFFCWGLATAFLALATLENKRWPWIALGVAVGVGSLAKYGMLLWPLGMLLFLRLDPQSRKHLRTPWPYVSISIGLLFLLPPLLWNAQHHWPTFHHVAKQTGLTTPSFSPLSPLELIAGQIGVLGPPLALLMLAAAFLPLPSGEGRGEGRRGEPHSAREAASPIPHFEIGNRQSTIRAHRLLLSTSLPLLALCLLASLRTKIQPNWPAAAYFGLTILTAHFIATHWRFAKPWLYATILFGLILTPIAHNVELVYPIAARLNIEPRRFDPTVKLKGWQQLGKRIAREASDPKLKSPFILCEDYMQTAELAFYAPGQPPTYCLGPYIADPNRRKRQSQYDLWPDRSLAQPTLKGRDAIYVGYWHDDLKSAFDRVEPLPEEPIARGGVQIRRFRIWRCFNFKGLTLPQGGQKF